MKTWRNITWKFLALMLVFSAVIFIHGCKDDDDNSKPELQTGTVMDIDSNVYKTVKIGNQWWMAENLRVRKYRNGQFLTAVNSGTPYIFWDTTKQGAFCSFNDDVNDTTGYLYNWYAIADNNNIAPEGWHIPTDAEWKELEKTLGMSQADADKSGFRGSRESEKLKQAGLDYWRLFEDIWANNESGFSALAGGCRMFNGTQPINIWSYPLDHQSSGFWWTASEQSEDFAWYRYLDYKRANVFRGHDSKNYGFSIRCVKD